MIKDWAVDDRFLMCVGFAYFEGWLCLEGALFRLKRQLWWNLALGWNFMSVHLTALGSGSQNLFRGQSRSKEVDGFQAGGGARRSIQSAVLLLPSAAARSRAATEEGEGLHGRSGEPLEAGSVLPVGAAQRTLPREEGRWLRLQLSRDGRAACEASLSAARLGILLRFRMQTRVLFCVVRWEVNKYSLGNVLWMEGVIEVGFTQLALLKTTKPWGWRAGLCSRLLGKTLNHLTCQIRSLIFQS